MRVGVLTGGGDCPGLNPAIRGAVMRGIDFGFEMVGLEEGWRGLMEKMTTPLTLEVVDEILYKGGTILGNANAVTSFNATNASSRGVALTNTAPLTITGISETGGGG